MLAPFGGLPPLGWLVAFGAEGAGAGDEMGGALPFAGAGAAAATAPLAGDEAILS